MRIMHLTQSIESILMYDNLLLYYLYHIYFDHYKKHLKNINHGIIIFLFLHIIYLRLIYVCTDDYFLP